MIEQIRQEIRILEESASRLRLLAQEIPGIQKNAEVILSYVYLLKLATPEPVKEEE